MDLESGKSTKKGAAAYSRPLLTIYDWFVLGIVNTHAWRCPTLKYLLPFFQQNAGKELLDVGVGTGYYLRHANLAPDARITLVDLNETALEYTKARLDHKNIECYVHDITKTLPMKTRFDSMSLFYLLHCMPAPVESKAAIFAHLKYHLTEDGVLFGATILGKGVHYNLFARYVRWLLNARGVFDNRGDTEAVIVAALQEHFHIVETKVVGTILIFKGARPKV